MVMRPAQEGIVMLAVAIGMFAIQPSALYSQATATGSITGRVMDRSGAVVPDARVTLSNEATGITSETTSGSEGYYTFPLLGPGAYTVRTFAQGFGPAVRSGIRLSIDQTARVDFTLEVGEVVQEISVSAEGPLLQTESGSVGQVINSITTEELPLNGRNFTTLALLSPGVTPGTSSLFGGTTNLQINGMRQSKTLFTIGGASITDKHFSGTKLLPPPDAIQEFKLQTSNMSAEFGAGGGVVNVELKSGTNELHGSLYEFLRNEKLDARNFFASERGVLKQNQFGFTLGGPIARNRTFLFGDYQGTRIRRGQTTNSPVPNAALRAGDFSGESELADPLTGDPFPNNQIPTSRFSEPSKYFLDFFPLPNNRQTYTQNASRVNDIDQFDVRMDHVLGTKDQLNGSYSFQESSAATPGPYPEVGGFFQDFRTQLVTLRETHTFTPSLLNQFSGSFHRNLGFTSPQGLGTNHTLLSGIGGLELNSSAYPGFPTLIVTGFTAMNGRAFMPLRHFQDMKWAGDTLTWIKGAHQVKIGGQARWYRQLSFNPGRSRGDFRFNGSYAGEPFADYLLGIPFRAQRDFPREQFGGFNQNQFVFAQDDWKVAPNLTLNLGLRYELNHARTALHRQAATYDVENRRLIVASKDGRINTTSQLATPFALPLYEDLIVTSEEAGLPESLRFTPKKTFAPRFGLAWQPVESVVVRAGYGIFYGEEEGNREGSTLIGNPPFLLIESAVFNNRNSVRTMENFFEPIAVGSLNINPLAFRSLDPYNEQPYIQQWNLTLEKRIARALSLQAGYVGSSGTHIEFANLANVPEPGPGAIQPRRPDPRWSEGSLIVNNSNSSYHALQVKAETRAWHGLTMLNSFAWSKSIDLVSDDPQVAALVQDPANPGRERGVSDFNVPLRATFSVVYDIPLFRNSQGAVKHAFSGWTLSSIVTLQSGAPFTPVIGADPANTGTSLRPDRIADGTRENPTLSEWFDRSAFVMPARFTYGNSGRNILRGPSRKNWNFGLFKTFAFHERLRLQFRAEAFNLTNTPPFGVPIANIQAGTAGRILTAGEPRELQFAVKLLF